MPEKKRKEILYTTAFDKNGVLVKAKDAEKNEDYFCPFCNGLLILKKSGKTGKGSKRPHFAHHAVSPNCTPEGVLHKSFKLSLMEKIKKQISEKTPINIEWECLYCHTKHKGNLLKYAADVKEEYQFENCRADLALIDRNNNPFAVIEIIVTHKPEETALNFYKEKQIILIQIVLESDDAIDKLDTIINFPTSVNYCFLLQCPNHVEYRFLRKPNIENKKCNSSHHFVSFEIITDHYFGFVSSNDFTDDEINIALSKGVVFQGKQVVCPRCESLREYMSKINRRIRRTTRRF
ncbi:MAG: hypothetical protein LBC76_09050 [Treponema sp.]|jgi:hypothetical protein|nr:hypothetical protein [Treponema sp.]